MELIRKAAVPIKKEMIPPIYDNEAKIVRNTIGFVVFFVQAIKISGGINPKNDSDKKKITKMYPVAKTLDSYQQNYKNQYMYNTGVVILVLIFFVF